MKPAQPSDPHELVGVGIPEGNRDDMAECVVEEYVLLGWDDRQLMSLFTRPCFCLTHGIYVERGHGYVETLIARARAKWTDDEADDRHA